jgi:hypothetical protein
MALPQRIVDIEPSTAPEAAPRVRRCTFRRLSRLQVGGRMSYEASCLYPDRRLPLPLGELEASAEICAVCTADHIFRPDED